MLPVCVDCQVQMKPEKNGVYVVKMFLDPPQPYQIFTADLVKCPGCGQEIVTGWGGKLAEHYEDKFAPLLQTLKDRGALIIHEYENTKHLGKLAFD